ncbi:RNA polymerase subunit sigma-70 [Dactylosporangium vinaceum]|uniref:RNA polymerase subunit sigma-70 n=1 Tax=Dactylosporangium vinaceum TaxID=53362 RepID=A0ABV5MDX4_9ACTN|nr:RNA polymerase subunit sigma-70 [Dactylosporangium vinaceum]UAC01018.1 RNA polymerase subunit sigma-70 [Dactylosporangium vinaceum]
MADERLEAYRTELTGYCYRMLGSGFEAEDAVQETLVRAWRAFARYDGSRGSVRTWLYRIATNVCLDMLRSAQRRSLAVDLRPFGTLLPAEHWVYPMADERVLAAEELAVRRETVRLAFVAALQHLPARQRAVLILRDVLCWSAEEVAGLLGTSTAAANSALQRARATLRAHPPAPGDPWRPEDAGQRELLERYCTAFERHDVAGLVALLHEDATMTMPPFAWLLRGRAAIRAALEDPQASCAGARLRPVRANGSAAFWQTRPGAGGAHELFALVVLDVVGEEITGITTYLEPERLRPLFSTPAADVGGLEPPARASVVS